VGSDGGVGEDSRLQRSDALSLGEYFLTFQRHSGPSSNCQDLAAHHHIPEDWHFQTKCRLWFS